MNTTYHSNGVKKWDGLTGSAYHPNGVKAFDGLTKSAYHENGVKALDGLTGKVYDKSGRPTNNKTFTVSTGLGTGISMQFVPSLK